MPELVYPPVLNTARALLRVMDWHMDVTGAEWLPRNGGAVVACNHVSYLDVIFLGVTVAVKSGRFVRIMGKREVFDNPVVGPFLRSMHHVPVDRVQGGGAYDEAQAALGRGEVIGVFPEATISRSFRVKSLKTGAARLAVAHQAPLIPIAVWGGQRLWTKGRPRHLRRHMPISVAIGEPLRPGAGDDPSVITEELRVRMSTLAENVQRNYPDRPLGENDNWWQPAYLGGSAPETDP
ncbi:MAG: lysophospholipid acyltransferase family protein [Stackebrandtia sp.]